MAIKKSLLLFGFTILFTTHVKAEETESYTTGFIPEKPEVYEATPQVKRYRANLPLKVDLSANFPTAGIQGKQSSCVAWATAYAARSYYEAVNQGWEANDPSHQFSPAFVYNQIRAGKCGDGSVISDALKLMKKTGVVPLAEFPYDPQDCLTIPDNQTLTHAASFRIKDWLRVNEKRLDDIKGQLYKGNPVIFGMSVNEDFHKLRGDEIYNDLSKPDPMQGHAMVLVGYDDSKQAFKLLNSWGTHWGNNGFGWVSYAAFLKRVQNTFVMDVAVSPKPLERLKPQVVEQPKTKVLTKAELEFKLTDMIGKIDCAKLNATVMDTKIVYLSGFAGQRADIDMLASQLQSLGAKVIADVKINPWPQCEVLLKFQQALVKPTDLKVAVVGKKQAVLRDGEQLTIEVVTPSYPSYLYVTYIQANGDAVHLVQPGEKMPLPLSPNTRLIFGDGKKGRALFKVAKPFGNEMIVAIATPTPLFTQKLPQTQLEREYLTQFQQVFLGLSETRVAAQDISAAVATLLTQAKP
jgi:hypothetical protein